MRGAQSRWVHLVHCVQRECQDGRSSSFTVFTVPEYLSCGTVTASKPFSHRGRAELSDVQRLLLCGSERDVANEQGHCNAFSAASEPPSLGGLDQRQTCWSVATMDGCMLQKDILAVRSGALVLSEFLDPRIDVTLWLEKRSQN